MAAAQVSAVLQCMRQHVRSPVQRQEELEGWEDRRCEAIGVGSVLLTWDPFPWGSAEGMTPARVQVVEVPEGWGLVLERIALCPDCFVDAVAAGAVR